MAERKSDMTRDGHHTLATGYKFVLAPTALKHIAALIFQTSEDDQGIFV